MAKLPTSKNTLLGTDMFELTQLEKKFACQLVFLSGDNADEIKEIGILATTKAPDQQSGALFTDDASRLIVDAVAATVQMNVNPTPANLAKWMVARKETLFGKDLLNIEAGVEHFIRHERGTEKPAINVAAYLLAELERVSDRRKLLGAAEELADIAKTGIGDPATVFSKMQAHLGEALPVSTADALTGDQIDELWLKEMSSRQAMTESGVPFMTLPKKLGLNDNIKRLKPGDSTIITAPTKAGKTSLALELMEHIATSGDGMMHGLYFHAETPTIDLQDRLVSSKSGVSMEDLRNGVMNDEIKKATADMRRWKQHTTFVYCAGWTPEQIAAKMRSFAAKLPKWHSLLVVVDYVDQDKLNLNHYKTDNIAYQLGHAFSVLRRTAEGCSAKMGLMTEQVYKGFVHVVAFQQENDEGRARGGRAGTMYSQNYIRMARTVAKKPFDTAWVYREAKATPPAVTMIKKGDAAPVVKFQVIATNDGYPGTSYVAVHKFKFIAALDASVSEDVGEKEVQRAY
jgi:replicative DNA helicase